MNTEIIHKPLEKPELSASIEYVTVSTPQHAGFPDTNHFAFNFVNDGWVFNKEKGCYEIYMMQSGLIDKTDYTFYSLETAKGAHGILFRTKEGFEKFKVISI